MKVKENTVLLPNRFSVYIDSYRQLGKLESTSMKLEDYGGCDGGNNWRTMVVLAGSKFSREERRRSPAMRAFGCKPFYTSSNKILWSIIKYIQVDQDF